MVSLKLINQLLKDASQNDHHRVTVFSVRGLKKLSFSGVGGVHDIGFGFPISVELYDVKPTQEKIPTVVNYGFEAIIPSDILKGAFAKLLQLRRKPTSADATLIAPRVHPILHDKITLSAETRQHNMRCGLTESIRSHCRRRLCWWINVRCT